MATNPTGWFDESLKPEGWFNQQQELAGWFDESFLNVTSGAGVTHATTGVLTGPGSAIVGDASSATPRPASGALTGPGSAVVGSAARTRAHPTTGALTGPGAQIVGSAARTGAPVTHATSGVLTGQGSAIAGAASSFTPHSTTGVLAGQSSAVAGSAARFRAFASTGALSGAGALVVGSAARTGAAVVHDTSGALDGGFSLLEAVAARGGLPPASEIEPIGGAFNIPTRQQMAEMARKQRIALGILPKPIQKKAKAAAKQIARIVATGGTKQEVQATLNVIPKAQRVEAMSAVQVAFAYYLAIQQQTQAQQEIARIQENQRRIAEMLAEIERVSIIQREEDDIAFLLMQVIMAE